MMIASAESVESIDDLLVEILLKLALRPLFHCKLVSRRWRSIIVNRVLVLVRRNPAPPAVGLFHPTGRFQTYKYLCFDSKTKKDRPPFLFLDSPAWHSRIHQSCNGLLLCCRSVDKPDFLNLFPPRDLCFSVYNPTTKRCAVLPHPCTSPASILAVNLAFDPSKSPFYRAVCIRRSVHDVLCRVDVYSAESKAWRLSTGQPPFALNALCAGHETPHIFRRGVYWNGSIHWIDSSAREVLCFNVDDERFHRVPLPAAMKKKKNLYDVEVRESYFGESCGHLHIAPVVHGGVLHVYEMEEDYSGWLFKCGILIDLAPLYAMFCSVLTITRGNNKGSTFLFALMDNGVVERYHFETQTHRRILGRRRRRKKNNAAIIPYSGLHGFQHIESLAPV